MSPNQSTPRTVRALASRGRRWKWLCAAVAAGFVIACGTSDVVSPPPMLDREDGESEYGESDESRGRLIACTLREARADSAVIGPAGGMLQVGNNVLVVPPGALLKPVVLRGEVPADTVASIRLFPEGLVFRTPAGLVLDAKGCADPPDEPKVLYLDDSGNVLEEIEAYYSPRWKRVAAPIRHFSRYALGV